MTGEETAEEWVKKNNYPYSNYPNIEKKLKQAFLAGLTASSPRWHDLRKDKNDLPDNSRFVWCDYDDGCGKGYYSRDDGAWWIEGHICCSIIDAWCEIPTFKE